MYDVVLRGGEVVTAGSVSRTDVGIEGGVITQLGGSMSGRRELDLRGLHVLPGGIDPHVHLSLPRDPEPGQAHWVDDFGTGSAAAAAGGVTTYGNMTFQRPGEALSAALERDLDVAGRQSIVDFMLHPVLTEPSAEAIAEIPRLAGEGHTSLKVFMTMPSFDARLREYTEAIATAGRAGTLTMIHCEDATALQCACTALLTAGRGAVANFAESRPLHAETVAVERALGLCRTTGAPLYVVHLSSVAALDICRRARAQGLPVYVEVRPLYLHLTEERFAEPDGAKYTGAPALRTPADRTGLWRGIDAGVVHTCGTDHAPWTLEQKLDPALTVESARQGVADLETMLPMLMSEGVRRGAMSLSRFVEVTSTNAAKLFGLYPRKGTIAVGADADLAVWDLSQRWKVDGARMQSRAGYSVYDGWELLGKPVHTLSRGAFVLEDGHLVATPGQGRWIRRTPTQRL